MYESRNRKAILCILEKVKNTARRRARLVICGDSIQWCKSNERITHKLMETRKDSKVRKSRLGRGVTSAQRVETIFPKNLSLLNEVKEKLMSFPVHFWGH
jgi:hypothetical protein